MEREVIAFFTPELAIHNDLHTYCGGLGVFSGGFLHSAAKAGLPLVGVTILPREGYYDQVVDRERRAMKVEFVKRYYDGLLEDTGVQFSLDLVSSPVRVKVWRLPGSRYATSPVYFLDTDVPENDYVSRLNTLQLYGGSRQNGANLDRAIAQALVLGKGGFEALKQLGIKVRLYHLNESHAFYLAMEIFHSLLEEGKSEAEATALTRKQLVFTTHTPVPAGNPEYPPYEIHRFASWNGVLPADAVTRLFGDPMNTAGACLRLAGKANAVSEKHCSVAKKLWAWVEGAPPLDYITNGVDRDFWQQPEFANAATAEELGRAKRFWKRNLLRFVSDTTERRVQLSENVPTLTWARRFAEYKRPKLLFYDADEAGGIAQLLKENRVQVLIAGKPHPDDFQMIDTWNDLYRMSFELPNLVVLPEYDLSMSKLLKSGSDLWLNTPRAPDEACGTSGMSAAMNGALNISTPDGWMSEANEENAFLFGSGTRMTGQDAYDAEKLHTALGAALELYGDQDALLAKAMCAKQEAETRWTTDRMVGEYASKLYELR